METECSSTDRQTIEHSKEMIDDLVESRTLELSRTIEQLTLEIARLKQVEAELNNSRQQFQDIIEFLPDATFVIDNEKKVIAWNRSIEEMTGVSKEDMLGKGDHAYTVPFYGERRAHLLDLLDVPDADLASKYQNIQRRGSSLCAEVFVPMVYGGKGAYIWAIGAPLYDADGNRIGAIESLRDISERKQTEEELAHRITSLTSPDTNISDLQFDDLFDLEEIQKIQDAFSKATGVASIITNVHGHPITRPSNFCRLCNDIIRCTEKGLANCYHSDAILGQVHPDGPIAQPCLSGGLWDGGASISVGGRHIANWLIGQVLDESCDMDEMMNYAREIGADEASYRQALGEVKRMSADQFKEVCNALFLIAGQLSCLATQNIQQARHITERTRAEEEIRNSERLMSTLYNITQYPFTNESEFLDHALDEVIRITGSTIGYIYFYDEQKRQFTLNTWSKEVMKECTVLEQKTTYDLDSTGIWGEAVRQRRPVLLNDFQADHPLKKGLPPGHVPLKRFLTVPVIQDEVINAVVGVGNKDADYSDSDVMTLQLFMDSVWMIAQRKRAEETLKLNAERTLMLLKLNQMVEASSQEITDFALEEAVRLTKSAIGYLAFMNEDESVLTMHSWSRTAMAECDIIDKPIVYPIENTGLWGEAVRQRQPVITNDYAAPNPYKKGHPDGHVPIRRHMNIPVFVGSRIVLVAGVGNKTEPYDNEDVQQLTLLMEGMWRLLERKQAEEDRQKMENQLLQAQKLESLGVLAGGIAHDFNNILMAIIGNADLALMRINPESPVVDNLHRIEQAAARAADLAKQMLAYSGKGKFFVEHLDMNRLLEEMLHMLEVSISKKALLRLNLHRPLPSVEADATQIRQIIMNLVINASEAIGDKSGVIAITTGCITCDRRYLKDVWLDDHITEGLYVYLEVADTGCGMDKETIGKLFDPFFTTKFTGRGLGMAAVMGIVRGHKGAINVYSEPDKGTTFKVLLPASSHPAEIFNGDSHKDDWKGEGTVLLVDDEETVRAIGSEMLRELGFEVITANDGREAIDLFKRTTNISFVILDLTMPHMDGEQCFRELRRLDPSVKVIMSSGYNEQEVSQRFVGKGLDGFVQKPYKLSILKQEIRNMYHGGGKAVA